MPGLLLHICCAPCLCHPHEVLAGEGIEFAGFWYNPNIHPYREYQARLMSLKDYLLVRPLELLADESYPLEEYIGRLLEDRCPACYQIRLEETARQAKERGFTAFSTTLLYSFYQPHDLVRDTGARAGRKVGVEFYYRDFRPGWDSGRQRARELGLYRQKYCGCIFSERDRYEKNHKPGGKPDGA